MWLLLFSHLVMSNSLWPHELQQARLPCPSLSPGVCSNCPLSQWWYLTISSSANPFSSCPQSFPASRPFSMSRLFASGSQSFRASASVLPMNIQGWSSLDWLFDLLAVQGTLKSLLQHCSFWCKKELMQKHWFFSTQPSLCSISHFHTWLLEKP